MCGKYISKLNFIYFMYHKTKGLVFFVKKRPKLSNETIYGLIPYKEGYVNEAYTFFFAILSLSVVKLKDEFTCPCSVPSQSASTEILLRNSTSSLSHF